MYTFVNGVIEHKPVRTPELYRVHTELAVYILPAGSRVWEGWMCEWLAVRTDGLPLRTRETVNIRFCRGFLTLPREGGGLLLSDTSTLGLVEHEWSGTVIGVRVTMDTVIVLGTNQGILVVEETVSTVTFGI